MDSKKSARRIIGVAAVIVVVLAFAGVAYAVGTRQSSTKTIVRSITKSVLVPATTAKAPACIPGALEDRPQNEDESHHHSDHRDRIQQEAERLILRAKRVQHDGAAARGPR